MKKLNLALIHVGQIVTMAGPNRARKGEELEEVGLVENGSIFIKDGIIVGVGPTDETVRRFSPREFKILDLKGIPLTIVPGFVDSHTHPAFWGTREEEYEMRIRGMSYEDIAKKGGGILNSAKRVKNATVDQIKKNVIYYGKVFLEYGTTTIEAKSGYGLSLEGELKLLRAIKEASRELPLDIVPTFLGAHAYPPKFMRNHRPYIDSLVDEMIPAVAKEGLAKFCDVFCDRGFFSVEESREILTAGLNHGLGIKMHADELSSAGGAELAVELGALSADHLEHISKKGIRQLAASKTVAGLLPGTAYNLGLKKWPPARELIASGAAICLATDFNPGSNFSLNMQLTLSIACSQLKMTPAEALCAATINGAYALGVGDDRGSIEEGKKADLAIMNVHNYKMIPYFYGVNHCVETFKDGVPLKGLEFLGKNWL